MNSESSMNPNIWPKVGSTAGLGHAETCRGGIAHPDHQQAVRSQVDGRTQRRGLAHGAVAEVLLMQKDRAEQERNGQARHQVLEGELHPCALARRPGPWLDGPGACVEGDRVRLGIAGRADADRLQVLLVHAARNAVEIEVFAQQLPQRRVVEQRARRMHQPASGEQREDPVKSRLEHARKIRLDHVMHAKLPPHLLDGIHRMPEMRRVRGNRDGAHGPGRGAGDDRKGVAGAATQELGDTLEHADLIRGARTAAGQYQTEQGILRH